MPNLNNNIPYVNLGTQYQEEREELLPIIDNLLGKGEYVGGSEIEIFEQQIASLCQVNYAVAFNSGTDALTLALHILGIRRGDEVITPPNSFIASTAVIVHLGAIPKFVDILPNQNIDPEKIEAAITEKTKAIMPVHLTGRICDMDPIIEIAQKYNLKIIEDAAQAIGSIYKGKPSGSFGDVGCFSTHPLKNLNACGDGGLLTTNDNYIYQKAKSLQNHGMSGRDNIVSFGFVSRMDNLQASILNYRIKKLEKVIKKRRDNAKFYFENIKLRGISLPLEEKFEFNTYHTFVIQYHKRDKLKQYLSDRGIGSAIHYPIPIHLQPASINLGYTLGDLPECEKQSKNILSLPINQNLSTIDLKTICSAINNFEA
jgi:dTDP-4-amino-4,6-dideoxygalactose transaminase